MDSDSVPEAVDFDKSSGVSCPLCGSDEIQSYTLPFRSIRHMDFGWHSRNNHMLNQCSTCAMIFGDLAQNLSSYFGAPEYAHSYHSEVHVHLKDRAEAVSNHFLQAGMVSEHMRANTPRILDIGCFDGRFLIELKRQFETCQLCGLDVSPHIGQMFPKQTGFEFFQGDIDKTTGTFDAVTFFDSPVYIRDLPGCLKTIAGKLNPGGFVFFMAPDSSRNRTTTLLGDQFYYFTPTNTLNLMAESDFEALPIDIDATFPRHLAFLAKPASKPVALAKNVDRSAEEASSYLNTFRDELERFVGEWDEKYVGMGRLGVLGTKHNAAAAKAVLGSRIDFFADETPHTNGALFHGMPVIHPSELEATDMLVLPYGHSAAAIAERLQSQYAFQVFPV